MTNAEEMNTIVEAVGGEAIEAVAEKAGSGFGKGMVAGGLVVLAGGVLVYAGRKIWKKVKSNKAAKKAEEAETVEEVVVKENEEE